MILRLLRIAILLAPIYFGAQAVTGTDSSHAQEESRYIDLSLELGTERTNSGIPLTVINTGNQPAYGVQIRVRKTSPSSLTPTLGEASAGTIPRIIRTTSAVWHIPVIQPQTSEHARIFSRGTVTERKFSMVGLDIDVTSESSEPADRLANNRLREWFAFDSAGSQILPAEPDYWVEVEVDEPLPSPGDTVRFEVKAVKSDERQGETNIADACVNVWLTGGLTLTNDDPSYTRKQYHPQSVKDATGRDFDKSDGRDCGGIGKDPGPDGVIHAGVYELPDVLTDSVSIMTLPVSVNADATVGEQCLIAKIFAEPKTGAGKFRDDASDNVAKLCLGFHPDEPVVFSDRGEFDLFTWYDCSEETTGPCGDSVSLELVALGERPPVVAGSPYRKAIFQPENVLVHIPDDDAGRATSSDSGSEALVWSTGFEHPGGGHAHESGDRDGIIISINTTPLDLETTVDNDVWGTPDPDPSYAAWEFGEVAVTLSGPGTISLWYHDNNAATAGTAWGSADGTYTAGSTYQNNVRWLGATTDVGFEAPIWLEFSALGTYKSAMTIGAPYDDDTTDETDAVKYADKATYTFHVGPLADLEVRDGGASHDAATNQTAFTVVAVNNRADAELDVAVAIDLSSLPSGVTVADHVASHGTYSDGTWALGDLKPPNYYSGIGYTENHPRLTLILAGDGAANATATATISHDNTNHPYTVCIGLSHTTQPYTNQTDCASSDHTVNVWHDAVCVDTADGEVNTTATHDTETECDAAADHEWTENVCASSDGDVRAGRTEAECGGWFQGTVYDYNSDNDTATLTARAGAGPNLKYAPTLETMGSPDSIIVLKWEPVATVNGLPVSHYQVQKWAEDEEDWEDQEPEKVFGTMWLDATPGEDPQYRARAVNEADVHGAWSEPVFGDQNTAADAAVEVDLRPGTAGIHRTLRVDEGEEIEYTIKLKSEPSFVVHVQVEADDSLTVITPPPPAEVPPLPNADHVVTFHPAEWKTAKRVKVRVNDDLVIEAPRTAKIKHTLPTTGGINRSAGYGGLTVPELTLTVDDTTVEKAGFASLGAQTLLLEVGETQSYEIRPLVKPTANLTIALTATPAGVVTIDDTDPDTDGIQSAITFSPGAFRAERDTETLPGTEFYAVPVNSPGPGVVSVTAVGAGVANITITSSGDGNFSTTKGAATQAVKVVAAKPQVSAPEFSTPLVAQTATVGTAFSYPAPEATDAQDDTITYAASLTGGSPLPGWLTFTPSTRTFSGTPQVCDGPASLPITITATDDSVPTPQTGAAEFTLTVSGTLPWHETVSKADYLHYAALNNAEPPFDQWYNRPPLFLKGESITLTLAENSAGNVKVGGPMTACDPDGDPLLYEYLDGEDIVHPDGEGKFIFALDENTGQLTTVSDVDYDYEGTFGERDDKTSTPGYDFWVIVAEQGTEARWLSGIKVAVNLINDPNN